MALNTYLGCMFIVIASAALSVAGLLIMRKVVHFEKFKPSHDVGGFLLSVVAVMYAVLLGLIVVDAMQQYNKAREVAEAETNCLTDLFILGKSLPEPRRTEVREACRNYARQVVDTEWGEMRCGSFCPIARDKAIKLMDSLVDFEPKTENEKVIYPAMIQESSMFWHDRQARLGMADKGVPAVEWVVLIIGGFTTMVFCYFFGVENAKLQIIMTGMVGMLIALNLSLLLLFAYPFSGDLAVHVDAFSDLQQIFSDAKPVETH